MSTLTRSSICSPISHTTSSRGSVVMLSDLFYVPRDPFLRIAPVSLLSRSSRASGVPRLHFLCSSHVLPVVPYRGPRHCAFLVPLWSFVPSVYLFVWNSPSLVGLACPCFVLLVICLLTSHVRSPYTLVAQFPVVSIPILISSSLKR